MLVAPRVSPGIALKIEPEPAKRATDDSNSNVLD